MSTNAIRQGQMSAKVSDGGAYSARLEAFQKNYKRPQFTDTFKEFNDIFNANQIKAEKFTESALGSKAVPSTTKMYESHFQLAKEKFDKLYSDETLEYYSKDDAGMRKWSGMVDQLNQEIKSYEQIYEDSWGTASANGAGVTWSDHLARMRLFNGDEQAYFESQGVNLMNPDSFNETMKRVDSRGHTNLTLDLESGTFNYDSTGVLPDNWLEPTDPNVAANLFSYQTEQGSFLGSMDFADKVYPTYKNYGENRVKEDNFTVMRNDFQFRLAAVKSYQDDLPEGDINKNKSVQAFREELEANNTLSPVLDEFQVKIMDDLNARASREKKTGSTGSTGGTDKDTLPPIYNSPPLPVDLEGVEGDAEDLVYITLDVPVYPTSQIGGSTAIVYNKRENKFYVTGQNTDGDFVEVDPYSIERLDATLTNKGGKYRQSMGLTEYIQRIAGSASTTTTDDAPSKTRVRSPFGDFREMRRGEDSDAGTRISNY